MKYRVWNIINVPNRPKHYDVNSPKEGIIMIQEMANMQLKMPNIQSNAFGINYFDEEENEWLEWEDEDGCGENDYSVVDGEVKRDDDGLVLN